MAAAPLWQKVDPERIRALALDMVRIDSPTGNTREVAELYARYLQGIGLEVELIRDRPATPVVVAYLRGRRPGPTITFNGHLDAVPIPHSPARWEGDTLYGRGSLDMKAPMAALGETLRVIAENVADLPGNIQVIAHGLHEAPGGYAEDLIDLVRRGVHGDAAVVCETAHEALPLIQNGMGIFTISAVRAGEGTHELSTPAGTPHPLRGAARLLDALFAHDAHLRATTDMPYIGPQTLHVAEVHGGDFFNRFPTRVTISGTRRYDPALSGEHMRAELQDLATGALAGTGLRAEVQFQVVREGYHVDQEERVVQALRGAYHAVTGSELPLTGSRVCTDVGIFSFYGKIPAVAHGPIGKGHHGDLESVSLPELVRCARIYAQMALDYLGARG